MLGSGVVMCNSLWSKEFRVPSAISVSTERSADQVACGSRALPKVLRGRNPAAARPATRRPSNQLCTFGPGTARAISPLGYEQSCVLVSLVLRLRPAVGQVHRNPGTGLHPSPGRLGGLGGRCSLRPRATAGQATVLVSRVRAPVCTLGWGEWLLVDRSRGDSRAVPHLPPAHRAGVVDLGDRVVAGTPTGAAPSIRSGRIVCSGRHRAPLSVACCHR